MTLNILSDTGDHLWSFRAQAQVSTGNRPSKRTRFSGPDCRVGELLQALYEIGNSVSTDVRFEEYRHFEGRLPVRD